MTTARAAAVRVVDRVLVTGAYSNVAIAAASVEPATDHAFFERLTYTTLRWLPAIDARLGTISNRPLERLDRGVTAILRVAAAEHLYLDGAPHAVVNEYVEQAKMGKASRASGFINAVLRSLVTEPRGDRDLRSAYPRWLVEAVERDLDVEPARAFLETSNGPAPVGVRRRPDTAAHYLRPESPMPTAGPDVDIIDPASAAVATAASVDAGMSILDVAAAPGGKTRALADAAGPGGMVVATDVHERRLRSAASRPWSPPQTRWVVADGRQPPFGPATFDRVVLDAPCTGLGTLRRRPEIRYRIEPDAPSRYGDLQRSLVEHAIRLVKPGGRIVYSVCTVFRAETIEVVSGLGFRPPEDIAGSPFGDGVLLGPHLGGTDGMFIAVKDVAV